MHRPFMSQAPVLKDCLTPPWVEQYLFHLEKQVRKAGWRSYTPKNRAFTNSHYLVDERDVRWFRFLLMRQMQHKFMKDALYQLGHPLWGRVQ